MYNLENYSNYELLNFPDETIGHREKEAEKPKRNPKADVNSLLKKIANKDSEGENEQN